MKLGEFANPTTRRGGGKVFVRLVAIIVTIFLGVGAAYAYFTARAKDKQEITFANISVDFLDSNKVYTTSLFDGQSVDKIQPGQSIPINNIYVKNIGEYDVYAIYKLTLGITKYGSTTEELFTYWYNLSGDTLTGDENSTTDKATLLAVAGTMPTSLTLKIPNTLDNSYKKATAKISLEVLAIQALLKEESSLSPEIQACQLLIKNQDQADIENILYIRPNGGTYNSSDETQTISQERGSTLEIGTPTRSGYTFTGWKFTGDGSYANNKYTFGKAVGSLTAQWQANSYGVSFDANGGELGDWNGNLFSANDFVKWQNNLNNPNGNISLTDDGIIKDILVSHLWDTSVTPHQPYEYSLEAKANTRYTFSCLLRSTQKRTDIGDNEELGRIRLRYTDYTYTEVAFYNNETNWTRKTLTSPAGKTVKDIAFTWSNWYWIDLKEVMFNEGATANEFKGYKDEKWVEYGGSYGTLPTPTREGYTFKGWLGASIVPDLSTWTLENGATYDATTGIVNFPNEKSSIYSPLIAVNGITSLYVKTLVSSSSADAQCHLGVNYYETATGSAYSSNGSAREITTANEWRYITHMFSKNQQILSGTCNYIRLTIQRSSYATQNYSVRNIQISSESADFANTYVTSSTLMATAANHALVADWTENTSTTSANNATDLAMENSKCATSQIKNQSTILPSKQKWFE